MDGLGRFMDPLLAAFRALDDAGEKNWLEQDGGFRVKDALLLSSRKSIMALNNSDSSFSSSSLGSLVFSFFLRWSAVDAAGATAVDAPQITRVPPPFPLLHYFQNITHTSLSWTMHQAIFFLFFLLLAPTCRFFSLSNVVHGTSTECQNVHYSYYELQKKEESFALKTDREKMLGLAPNSRRLFTLFSLFFPASPNVKHCKNSNLFVSDEPVLQYFMGIRPRDVQV